MRGRPVNVTAMRPLTLLVSMLAVSLPLRAAAPAARSTPAGETLPPPAEVLALLERVADWQLADPAPLTPSNKTRDSWVRATFYIGAMALSDISASPRFEAAMLKMSRDLNWKPKDRIYHADDHAVTQMYSELYFRHRDPAMLAPTLERFDYILAHPMDDKLEFVGPQKNDRWAWCDSLFMGPPAWLRAWAATGRQEYLDFMVTNWWKTSAGSSLPRRSRGIARITGSKTRASHSCAATSSSSSFLSKVAVYESRSLSRRLAWFSCASSPVYCQITLMTGMLIAGKISVGVRNKISGVSNNNTSAETTNV